MLEGLRLMVGRIVQDSWNQMGSVIESVKRAKAGEGGAGGGGSEIGARAQTRIDQIAVESKARVGQLIGPIVSKLTGGDAPQSLLDALNAMAGAASAQIDTNAGLAHTAVNIALAARPVPEKPAGDGAKHEDRPPTPEHGTAEKPKGDRPAGDKPGATGDRKPASVEKPKAEKPTAEQPKVEKPKAEKPRPVVKPVEKPKPEPKPKANQKRPEPAGDKGKNANGRK
jgi:hypothetical protein